jgi:hypothetical protein
MVVDCLETLTAFVKAAACAEGVREREMINIPKRIAAGVKNTVAKKSGRFLRTT